MNSDVKRFFKRETRSLAAKYKQGNKTSTTAKFDELFYVFNQLVEYDVEVQAVEGLRERLPYALTKIASEKIDRNDIITLFPVVWGKFESFVRKLLYICDREQYWVLSNDKSNTLKNYLDAFNILVNTKVPEYNQDSITITYKIRNIDSHTCELWGLQDFYKYLDYSLDAYLFVVEKTLSRLQKAKVERHDLARVQLTPPQEQIIIVNPRIQRYQWFFRIEDFNSEFVITSKQRGLINKTRYSAAIPVITDNTLSNSDPSIQYERAGNRVVKKIYLDDFWNGSDEKVLLPSMIYEYDEDGRLSSITNRDYKPRYGEYIKGVLLIDYEADGCVTITDIAYHLPDSRKEGSPTIKNRVTRKYDSLGRIVDSFDNKGFIERYQYRDDGLLVGFSTRDGSIFEVDYIGEEVLFIEKNLVDDTEHLRWKYIYQNGRISKIIFFGVDKLTDSAVEDDVWTLTYRDGE